VVAEERLSVPAENNHRGMTATAQLGDSYYGLPVVKAPHWRWLVIFYFFLGGISGASFTIGTVANLFARNSAVERAARYVSLAALIPCPPLLILDLGRPERFMNMLRVVKLKSPMSLGSWAISGLGACVSVEAGLQIASDLAGRRVAPRLRDAVGILGLPFSIFLSGYTGVLLAATNIPLWWRASPFLTPAFVSSAFSTSLACISQFLQLFGPDDPGTSRKLNRAEAVCLTVETVAMTSMLVRLGSIGEPLRAGKLGRIFWPVTFVGGLLLPLGLQLTGPFHGTDSRSGRRRVAAGLTLLGGFSLRALMIFAGRESAQRPKDYFQLTEGIRSRE
jgi:formate-dependent nitrite reductase membrane component NrfD